MVTIWLTAEPAGRCNLMIAPNKAWGSVDERSLTTSICGISRLILPAPGGPGFAKCMGVIMRKLALLIAAALVVSVPLSTIVSTDSYAAKAKRHHHHRVARV